MMWISEAAQACQQGPIEWPEAVVWVAAILGISAVLVAFLRG